MMNGLVRMRALGALLLAAGLLLPAGCGDSKGGYSGPTGTVSGKVTLKGQPVPTGCLVTFLSDSGQLATGKVGADGTYQLSASGKPQVPAVKYSVAVASPPAPEMSKEDYEKMMSGKAGEAPKPEAAPSIPATYASTATSGLSYDVKAGDNKIDIELK